MSKCLYCYEELQPNEVGYHLKCCRRAFSRALPPILPYSSAEIISYGDLQLSIDKESNELRFVDGVGQYSIRSNNAENFSVQLEAVTMRMADMARVAVMPHSLICSNDGELHHIIRTPDQGKKKLSVEIIKMVDLLEQEDCKEYETIAEALKKHSTTPKLDNINLYERLLFSYLVGDTELNLGSFIMAKNGCGTTLAPASRIMPHALISSSGEMPMTLNKKSSDLTREDFQEAMTKGGLEPKIIENLFAKFERSIDPWCDLIDASPLPESLRESFKFQMIIRFDTL
ncbi:MAG: HipA domain-containing protein [Rikenellaceae bacterium]